MPVIKPRSTGQKTSARLLTKLKTDNYATLLAYADYIKEDVGYVLDQLIETVLAKDKDFLHVVSRLVEAADRRPEKPELKVAARG